MNIFSSVFFLHINNWVNSSVIFKHFVYYAVNQRIIQIFFKKLLIIHFAYSIITIMIFLWLGWFLWIISLQKNFLLLNAVSILQTALLSYAMKILLSLQDMIPNFSAKTIFRSLILYPLTFQPLCFKNNSRTLKRFASTLSLNVLILLLPISFYMQICVTILIPI